MSASPLTRQVTSSQAIPTRKVLVTDPSQIPDVYSSTPGGTIFSTTPGGTRIIYERSFLMSLSKSPISKTPPNCSLPASVLRNPGSVPIREPMKSQRSDSLTLDETQETFSMDL